MPFDSTFLQQFFNLPMEVTDLREKYNEVRHDIHRMAGRMDSIEKRVTYFWGFVDPKRSERKGRGGERRSGPFKRPESVRRGIG